MGVLTKFFLVVFASAWTCFITIAVISQNTAADKGTAVLIQALGLLGTITPSLTALWLLKQTGNWPGIRVLLNRVVKWQVNSWWYVFAVFFFAVLKLFSALLYKMITGAWPLFGNEPLWLMFLAIPFSTPVQAGEEIGWRGFALPRMVQRWGLSRATLLLGIIWACWHLPLFFVKGANTYGQSFPLYLLQVTALSVIVGWLYWRTGASLLLVMLLHAAVNNTKDMVPSMTVGASNPFSLSHSLVAWITVGLLWFCAGIFLYQMRNVKKLPT